MSQQPKPPLSAAPSPIRQASPPSSFPAQWSSLPSPVDAFTPSSGGVYAPAFTSTPVSTGDRSDESDTEYSSSSSPEAPRRKRRNGSRDRQRHQSGDEATPGRIVDPSSFSAPRVGGRMSSAVDQSQFADTAEYELQDEELIRLARIARRTERKIRRESRGESDPGHGYSQPQQSQQQTLFERRASRQRSRAKTRRHSDSGPDLWTGASITSPPRQLVLRNI